MGATVSRDRDEARVHAVREHIRLESQGDIDGLIRTFGSTAEIDDTPNGERHIGSDGVRVFYRTLMTALPDLELDIPTLHVAEAAVVAEGRLRGTHLGPYRGLPATGRRIDLPLCAVFTFNDDDSIACERVYYDRVLVLQQLGVFHDPEKPLGRALTVLTHPVTMLRVAHKRLSAG